MKGQQELFPKWGPHLSSYKKRVGRRGVKKAKAILAEVKARKDKKEK